MTDDHSSDLLSALPRSRPHRRSAKRPAREAPAREPEAQQATREAPQPAAKKTTRAKATPATRAAKSPRPAAAKASKPAPSTPAKPRSTAAKPKRLPQPAQPRGVPRAKRGARPEPSTEFPVLRTAVQAAAELTEIGVTLSAKALRRVVGRLPRP
ncbi:MAG TPA: hypothetical protein VMD09_04280 [Solirubrobacteraceae bacterium]|nr:hypothetical protein [Solirubrobacteraceae bacterium]